MKIHVKTHEKKVVLPAESEEKEPPVKPIMVDILTCSAPLAPVTPPPPPPIPEGDVQEDDPGMPLIEERPVVLAAVAAATATSSAGPLEVAAVMNDPYLQSQAAVEDTLEIANVELFQPEADESSAMLYVIQESYSAGESQRNDVTAELLVEDEASRDSVEVVGSKRSSGKNEVVEVVHIEGEIVSSQFHQDSEEVIEIKR